MTDGLIQLHHPKLMHRQRTIAVHHLPNCKHLGASHAGSPHGFRLCRPSSHAQVLACQQVRSQELKAGGGALALTNANKLQYCYLLAHWHLHGRLGASAAAFASGLAQVQGPRNCLSGTA